MSRRFHIWKYLREHGPTDSRGLQRVFGDGAAQLLWQLRRSGHVEIDGPRTRRGHRYRATNLPPPCAGEIGARLFDALDWLREYGESMPWEYAADMGITRSCARERFRRLRERGLIEFRGIGNRGFGKRNVGLTPEGEAVWQREHERRRVA